MNDEEEGKSRSSPSHLSEHSRKSMPQSNHTSYNYILSPYYLHIFVLEYATYCYVQYTHPAKILKNTLSLKCNLDDIKMLGRRVNLKVKYVTTYYHSMQKCFTIYSSLL